MCYVLQQYVHMDRLRPTGPTTTLSPRTVRQRACLHIFIVKTVPRSEQVSAVVMEPEDVHFRSAEHLIGEEENEKATFERKEDGEEHRKAGRAPLSRIPTFQSSVGRKRVTVQSAESSPKTDGSVRQGHKERAGPTEAGRVKTSGSGGRETAVPVASARLHTSLADVLSQGDISGHASTLLAPKINQSLDQTPEITKDSDQVDMSLKRPPLRNVYEASDLVIEPVSEFETASGETISEDEQTSARDSVEEDLSSCSSVDQREGSDQACEDTLRDDNDDGSVAQSHWTEENSVTGNDVKCEECVPDKDDGSILSGQDETTKTDSKICFKETQQRSKTANTTQTKHAETKTCTPSKQTKGRSFSLFCLLPTILLLLGGFASHVWQYGVPKSVSHLMSQLELHWLESFWMPQETCISDCRLTLVESVPEGLVFPSGSPHLPSISDTWINLLNKANRSVHIGAFYFTLQDSDLGLTEPSSVLGKKVFDRLKQLEPKGVKLKIAVNAPQTYIADTDELVATGAEVRGVDLQSITGGILHTKLWVVDKKHMYLGSANMDWRSLTQVKEVGVSVEDCSCLAQDASRIFDVYWDVGAQSNGSLPPFWPGRFSALSSSKYPLAVKFNGVPARVYLSSSPPPLSSHGRSDDLSSILSVIADAERFIYVSVMDYLPMSQFTEPIRFWPVIDSALREAACTRGVEVKLLVSCWNHSPGAMFVFLQSLSVLNMPPLSCNIHAKVFEVPSTREQQRIPFARVNHAKYMVTDRVVYIGTSNWSENYFTQTAGVGLVVNQTGSAVGQDQNTVQSQMQEIFQRDWRSEYAQTLTDVHAEHCSGKKLT
ncbi:5'-3' exonuclease PLD3-like isoform X1 [Cyprinus carpio]|uniref:5'-3' exonuclease PLD3-like isoform X1 n=1 Tax=Cyprinus carpio TaxID=7962 RepID=A0A9Q9X3E6_CYPCA|nr:5'-3' exonuclease PLD3-like isoform X1 [Cyprinus carpio]